MSKKKFLPKKKSNHGGLFVDSLALKEKDSKLFRTILNDCYKYAAAIY
jgi:hypothetical protein